MHHHEGWRRGLAATGVIFGCGGAATPAAQHDHVVGGAGEPSVPAGATATHAEEAPPSIEPVEVYLDVAFKSELAFPVEPDLVELDVLDGNGTIVAATTRESAARRAQGNGGSVLLDMKEPMEVTIPPGTYVVAVRIPCQQEQRVELRIAAAGTPEDPYVLELDLPSRRIVRTPRKLKLEPFRPGAARSPLLTTPGMASVPAVVQARTPLEYLGEWATPADKCGRAVVRGDGTSVPRELYEVSAMELGVVEDHAGGLSAAGE